MRKIGADDAREEERDGSIKSDGAEEKKKNTMI